MRQGRVGLWDAIVLGLSGSGPAQTLAVSLASLVAVSGHGGAVAVLACSLPMLGIALGYQRLNRWEPSAGATYTWVARVFHPYLGFLAGWMILLYYTFGTGSLTIPAGTYSLTLLAPSLADQPLAVAGAAACWNLLVTVLALAGLRVAARFEWAIVVFQYAVLAILAGAGLVALVQGGGVLPAQGHGFSLDDMGGLRGLVGGIVIACFMFSGWDASIYVNEESAERLESPGRAAISSVAILAVFYVFCVLGLQSVLRPEELAQHGGDALSFMGTRLLGGGWGVMAALAVLTGTLASLQAAVISAARVALAMSRDGVLPPALRRTDALGNPWMATLVAGILNLALLLLSLATHDIARALENVTASLGLISLVFYGLTGAAAVWQGRDRLLRGPADLVLGGLLPGGGALFMAWVVVESVRTGAVGGEALAWGLGSVLAGLLVAALSHRIGRAGFFESVATSASTAPSTPSPVNPRE